MSSNSTVVSSNSVFWHAFHDWDSLTLCINIALNLLSSIKKKMNVVKSDQVDEIIESMKIAASYASPNFRNKLELLEAEQYGACNYPDKAMTSYNASIESARKNNYIHEQGLACEMAGFYCKRMRYTDKSLEYFNMARRCYCNEKLFGK